MPGPMEVWDWLTQTPWAPAAVLAAAAVLYLLLSWKPRSVRDAERRARRLTEEGNRRYRTFRRPG